MIKLHFSTNLPELSRYFQIALFLLLFVMFSIMGDNAFGAGQISAPSKPAVTDLTIEQLMTIEVATVYSASKFEQKITQAPASVSIVTESDIKQYGYRTLADILRSMPGFYTSYDRTYTYAGIRGFSRPGDYNTRLLLLVDGHRINDSIYDQASIGTEFILDVALIDRVELVRGPGSSLYGNNAFFGVINVITKQPQSFNGFEVSGSAGSFDTYKERATYGKKYANGFEMLLSGTNSNSKGQSLYFKEFNTPANNNGRADSCDYEKYNNLFANMKYRDFSLQGAYTSREKGIPTAYLGTVFNENRTRATDERGYIDLKYNKALSENTHIKARGFYDYYNYSGNFLFDYPPLTMNKDVATGKWWGGEFQLTQNLFEKHKVVMGMEYQDYFLQKQRNYDENPYIQYFTETKSSYTWAAHIQDQFSILDNLILNAGIRYDYYKTFGGSTNPRAALIYTPFEKTTIKLLYGQAFRAPNAFESYYNDGNVTQKANPNLTPEKIETYELVLEQYVKNYRFSASGYYYRVKDLINLYTDPADSLLVFRNIGKTESKGAQLKIEGKWSNGIEAKASYSIQETIDKETGRSMTNSPKHLAKLNIFSPLISKKLSTGLELQYTSSRRTFNGDSTGGFVIANLTLLSREVIKDLEVSGTIYNLFNKKYGDPVSNEFRQNIIVQDGRTFRIKFTYRF
ncbi:MAG: TonB-dependent receptor [Syntrophus sp. (in: bacteria)]|nr:TonB-dependent receptor [Syntrophus sp. (in: bacteria)]